MNHNYEKGYRWVNRLSTNEQLQLTRLLKKDPVGLSIDNVLIWLEENLPTGNQERNRFLLLLRRKAELVGDIVKPEVKKQVVIEKEYEEEPEFVLDKKKYYHLY